MNHFQRFIFICIMTLLLSCSCLFAADKEYTIKSADFHVELQKNGDATVTETWTVDFTKGNFTRFYVERYLKLPKLEIFSDITYHSFTDSFNIKTDSTYETYAWYMDAQNEKMTFTVKYTLQNVVKTSSNDIAQFCYRFVGERFEKQIKK